MQTTDMVVNIEKTLEETTVMCRRNFRTDTSVIINLDVAFSEQVLPCPCTLNQARNDPRFKMDAEFRAGSICYIQCFAASGHSEFSEIKYGQHCCYDNNG